MAAIGVSERALLGSTQRGKHTHTRANTHTYIHIQGKYVNATLTLTHVYWLQATCSICV